MNNLKNIFGYLYLAILSIVAAYVFVRGAEAGNIRKMQVSPEKSGMIRLAQGRNTTISFLSRPEKVVPGSPQALEVSFIGKDLNIRPLQGRPGNLTVYTKSERIVLLLQVTGESNYDDVVEIIPYSSRRGFNLLHDTYK